MKSASGSLITLLATAKQFYMTETYVFTLADGTVLTWQVGENANGTAISLTEPQAPVI